MMALLSVAVRIVLVMLTTWPPCLHRTLNGDAPQARCQHPKVTTPLVVLPICETCPWREDPANKRPGLLARAKSIAGAVATFVASGMRLATPEEVQARTAVCCKCERRQGTECTACGCTIAVKAKIRAMGCPLGKWQKLG